MGDNTIRMDESTQGVQTESAPQSEAPSQNNAPVEQPSAPSSPSGNEQQPSGEQQPERKMAPVENIIEERQRRKQAEQYSKQLESELAQRGIATPQRQAEQPTGQPAPAEPQQPAQPQYQQPRPDVDVEFVDAGNFVTKDQLDFRERESASRSEARTEYADEYKRIPDLDDLAEGYRQQQLLKHGRFLTPKESVDGFLKTIRSERLDAQKAPTTSVKIQEQAAVQGSGTRPDISVDEIKNLKDSAANGSRKEKAAALQELIKRGVI